MMNNARGMTLVEVVVATVIFSIIMLATVTALRTFALTYERIQHETQQTEQLREVDRFLRSAIRDALNQQALFSGESAVLQWVAPLDRIGEAAGLQHLRLAQQGQQLTLSFAPLGASNDAPNWAQMVPDFPLLTNLESLVLTYRSNPSTGWGRQYAAEGGTNNYVPWAVSIELTVEGVTWPPIVVNLNRYRLPL